MSRSLFFFLMCIFLNICQIYQYGKIVAARIVQWQELASKAHEMGLLGVGVNFSVQNTVKAGVVSVVHCRCQSLNNFLQKS